MITKVNVFASRWFQKSAGNTYHNVMVQFVKDGKIINELSSGTTYGYGEHYKQTAEDLIEKSSIIADEIVYCSVRDVKRKKDLTV